MAMSRNWAMRRTERTDWRMVPGSCWSAWVPRRLAMSRNWSMLRETSMTTMKEKRMTKRRTTFVRNCLAM